MQLSNMNTEFQTHNAFRLSSFKSLKKKKDSVTERGECVAGVLKEKEEAHHPDGHHCEQVGKVKESFKREREVQLQPRWVAAVCQR